MWLQRSTSYLLKHRWQALALTFFISLFPIIGAIGIIIAALVTLMKGLVEGAIFTVAATLPYFISFYLSGNNVAAIPLVVWAAIGVAVFSNILTWIFAVMLYKKSNWSTILQVAALMGVLLISVVHLVYPEIVDWWGLQLQSLAQTMSGALKDAVTVPNETQLDTINTAKQYATGMMVAAVFFDAVLQLVIARWWQANLYTPGSLRTELQNIRLSPLAGFLFIGALLLSYLGNSVLLDIMPVLYILFGAAGLSLAHYVICLVKSSSTLFWLSLLYVVLFLTMPFSVILLALIALVDVWLNIRKRITKV